MLIRTRIRRSTTLRVIRYTLIILAIWTAIEAVTIQRALSRSRTAEIPPLGHEKIFIASIHWTDELVLRTHWMAAVLDLAKQLGPPNVFVSIYESGSLDNTKGALRELDAQLDNAGIGRRVILDETMRIEVTNQWPAETGWVSMPQDKWVHSSWTEWAKVPKGKMVPRRIPYLASLRNRVLEPLYQMQESGQRFDKILFLNDVAFTVDDVRTLLGTRDGDYAAACSLDFKRPPKVYDTFALRDSDGHEPLMETWPYFRAKTSRAAIMAGQPAQVTSCWNGMVVMDAEPFYDQSHPLIFRGIPDGLSLAHLEGSECCLIHADNTLSITKGVWINPNVRVGYNTTAYNAIGAEGQVVWPSWWETITGSWKSTILRLTSNTWSQDRTISRRIAEWQATNPGEKEVGGACIIDEMQVLIWNGWTHV